MQAQYFDPLFYISSKEMPFNIRIEVSLKEPVCEKCLTNAVNTAIKRFPYFSIRVVEKEGELLTVPNDLPIVVYSGLDVYPLGSEKVNYHMLAIEYSENTVYFCTSHVITDGGGFEPFMKSVLYYYLSEFYNIQLDSNGIYLIDTPFFDDEIENPYPEELMKDSEPLYVKKCDDYFRLCNGGYVKENEKGKVFRFKVRENDMMAFSFDHDGSPSALMSVLMAKAIWDVHPDIKNSIVSAVSFNLRPGLGNRHNYRMLCSSILLEYTEKMKNESILKMCTCSRGMVSLQSQPENVIYYASQRKNRFENLKKISSLDEKKKIIGQKSLEDSVDNTFSVSYVGKVDYGSLKPYIDTIYNVTDGSTYKTAFIEIASTNGWFNIAFIQGFSSDVYYKSLLNQFNKCNIKYIEDDATDLIMPTTELP